MRRIAGGGMTSASQIVALVGRRQRSPLVNKPLYLAPAFALLAIFFLLPALLTVVISFTDWTLGGKSLAFVGLDNYRDLFAAEDFHRSLVNTLKLNAFVIPASFIIALLLALAIHSTLKASVVWQTVYFLPVTTTLVAMAFVWQWVLHPEFGVVAWVLGLFGIGSVNWLNDPRLVLFTIGIISLWQLVGYYMVLFLAGLLSIPRALYEAAEVDGARRPIDRFLHVTWPMLGPTALFVLIITVIKSFQIFDVVRVLTKGGPNKASEIILHTLYQEGFVFFRTGRAAAIATLFFVVMLALTLYQMRVLDRRVHYG
jgi:multiple sugar transport system permease protein